LEGVFDYVYDETGIIFNTKRDLVKRRIKGFAEGLGYESEAPFLEALKNSTSLKEKLFNLLTVNETYFYREIRQIEIFANLASHINDVRILCAPCASGEEPYTILMHLEELGARKAHPEIVGIDINSDVIEQARVGRYTARRLHRLPAHLKERYFTPCDKGEYQITPHLKQSVHFQQMNVFGSEMSQLGQFDMLFSRNMLIYFDQKSRAKACEAFHKRLKKGGWLFLGHADILEHDGFERFSKEGIIYYQKR